MNDNFTERRFIHPHDERYVVIDTLDSNGCWVATRNVRRPSDLYIRPAYPIPRY